MCLLANGCCCSCDLILKKKINNIRIFKESLCTKSWQKKIFQKQGKNRCGTKITLISMAAIWNSWNPIAELVCRIRVSLVCSNRNLNCAYIIRKYHHRYKRVCVECVLWLCFTLSLSLFLSFGRSWLHWTKIRIQNIYIWIKNKKKEKHTNTVSVAALSHINNTKQPIHEHRQHQNIPLVRL